MRLAGKKASIDQCPDVTEEAKAILNEASAPPIAVVSAGVEDNKIELGGETVLYRHDKTFYHPTGIAVSVSDNNGNIEDKAKLAQSLVFDRVGQTVRINLIAVKNESGDPAKFAEAVKKIQSNSSLPLILMSDNTQALEEALKISAAKKPIIYAAGASNYEQLVSLAKNHNCSLVVKGKDLDELSQITQKISLGGFKDLVLDPSPKGMSDTIQTLTQIRRLALKKNYRPLGYPVITFTNSGDNFTEAVQAASYIAKYGSIVVVEGEEIWEHLALVTMRQNIYTDPQKPVAVESKIYEVGGTPTPDSPLMVTTNFSLTYFTVSPEIEASKIPSWLLVCDAEGMSVLTAWAAEKFTPESIVNAMQKLEAEKVVNHKKLIIPGYVAVMKGKLEDASGWDIIVGPREASGIPAFMKETWK
jgi:acetyl-CoA decarbonylase/synthase complex subunit gamma